METIKVLELFGGIGACTRALDHLGIPYELVDYVEIDKYAVASFNAIHGTSFAPQDICDWDKKVDVDLIMHGSPCQDFSTAGLNRGGDEGSGTRSSLMYETLRIVQKLMPSYVIWENVKNLLSEKHRHNFDKYLDRMEAIGYRNYWQVLNSKDYGVPQNRERVFTISIRKDIHQKFSFPKPIPLELRLKDMLEDNPDVSLFLSDKLLKNFIENNKKQKDEGNGVRPSFEINSPKRLGNVYSERYGPGMAGNVYDADSIAMAHPAQLPGGSYYYAVKKNWIPIKNATKKGYTEAYEGDYVNLQYPNSKTRRARVGGGMAMTIMANDENGVVTKDDRYLSEKGVKYVLDPKRGMATDINADVAQPVTAKGQSNWTGSFVSEDIKTIEKSTTIGSKEPTVIHLEDGTTMTSDDDTSRLRIRKLSARECWRLMGFDDEAYERAEKVNSKTQLYKQAGNSIVVNVLEAIFKELLLDKKPLEQEQMSIFDFLE